MLTISFIPPSTPLQKAPSPDYTPYEYTHLAMEACEALSETNCQFRMGGFGQDDWGLDVRYDLSSVIEQLPVVLKSLRLHAEVELDMYTQGIERKLTFVPEGDLVAIKCQSQTSWVPKPAVIRQSASSVKDMIERLAVDFAKAIDVVTPQIGVLQPFAQWKLGNV